MLGYLVQNWSELEIKSKGLFWENKNMSKL